MGRNADPRVATGQFALFGIADDQMIKNRQTVSEFAARIDATVAAWKAKIRRDQNDAPAILSARDTSDVDTLRRAAADLESDLAAILADYEHEVAGANAFETLAMDAIRRGDDRAARDALVKQQESADRFKQLDAEATVLREMLAECQVIFDKKPTQIVKTGTAPASFARRPRE